MFRVTKTLEIAGSHSLKLPYISPCSNAHGHNWKVSVTVQAETLNAEGMILDFSKIKQVVNQLDHQNLNHLLSFNPTAENIAFWIAEQVTEILPPCGSGVFVTKVVVQESEGNVAVWER